MRLTDVFWISHLAASASAVATICVLWRFGFEERWLRSFAATTLAVLPGLALLVEFGSRLALYIAWDVLPVDAFEYFSVPLLLAWIPVGMVLIFMAARGRAPRPGMVWTVQFTHVATWVLSGLVGWMMAATV